MPFGPSILKIVRSRGQVQNLGTISESAISPGAVSVSGWSEMGSFARGHPGRAPLQLTIGFVWHRGFDASAPPSLPLGSFGAGASTRARPPSLPLGSFGAGAWRVVQPSQLTIGFVCAGAWRVAPPSQLTIGFVWRGGMEGGAPSQLTIGFVWRGGMEGGAPLPAYHWVRLARGYGGWCALPAYHWVRLAPGHRGEGQSLQIDIGFVWRRGIEGGQSLQIDIGFVWRGGHQIGSASSQTTIAKRPWLDRGSSGIISVHATRWFFARTGGHVQGVGFRLESNPRRAGLFRCSFDTIPTWPIPARSREIAVKSVAVVGASGAVGEVMIRLLQERKFPVGSIKFLASERSAGKTIEFDGETYPIEPLTPEPRSRASTSSSRARPRRSRASTARSPRGPAPSWSTTRAPSGWTPTSRWSSPRSTRTTSPGTRGSSPTPTARRSRWSSR